MHDRKQWRQVRAHRGIPFLAPVKGSTRHARNTGSHTLRDDPQPKATERDHVLNACSRTGLDTGRIRCGLREIENHYSSSGKLRDLTPEGKESSVRLALLLMTTLITLAARPVTAQDASPVAGHYRRSWPLSSVGARRTTRAGDRDFTGVLLALTHGRKSPMSRREAPETSIGGSSRRSTWFLVSSS